jgi:hypothetical protein
VSAACPQFGAPSGRTRSAGSMLAT